MNLNLILEQQKEIAVLQSVMGILSWDRDVNLPQNSEIIRMHQEQVLSKVVQQKYLSESFQQSLSKVDRASLSEQQRRELHLIEREAAIKTSVPPQFLQKFIELQNLTYSDFKKAKESGSFSVVQNNFEQLVENYLEFPQYLRKSSFFCKTYANLSDYDVMIDSRYDPGIRNNFLIEVFTPLKNFLIEAKKNLPKPKDDKPKIQWSSEKLLKMSSQICKDIGFDFSKGRIDITPIHPFCGGSIGDVRITTKVDDDSPIEGLMSTLHEVGHGIYEQNLPEEFMFSPLGVAPSAAIHESQSRFVENQIGRSVPFIRYLSRISGESVDDLSALLLSRKKTFIRVDSDEIDYNLHIMLRWDLEQAIVSRSIKVKDIPQYWNELYENYFGDKVPNNSMGCLQDIHWYSIGFGYFPSYALGNLIAAQLFHEFQSDETDWGDKIESGNLRVVNHWLKQKVHNLGSKFDTLQTMESAFGGKKLDPKYLINYLSKKYLK